MSNSPQAIQGSRGQNIRTRLAWRQTCDLRGSATAGRFPGCAPGVLQGFLGPQLQGPRVLAWRVTIGEERLNIQVRASKQMSLGTPGAGGP